MKTLANMNKMILSTSLFLLLLTVNGHAGPLCDKLTIGDNWGGPALIPHSSGNGPYGFLRFYKNSSSTGANSQYEGDFEYYCTSAKGDGCPFNGISKATCVESGSRATITFDVPVFDYTGHITAIYDAKNPQQIIVTGTGLNNDDPDLSHPQTGSFSNQVYNPVPLQLN